MQEDLKQLLISIHALREEGDTNALLGQWKDSISIHALREEGDADKGMTVFPRNEFLSTPSARRATRERGKKRFLGSISIHALREEGDLRGTQGIRL